MIIVIIIVTKIKSENLTSSNTRTKIILHLFLSESTGTGCFPSILSPFHLHNILMVITLYINQMLQKKQKEIL
jgi:hypothetical protein